eukprot:g13948.t2
MFEGSATTPVRTGRALGEPTSSVRRQQEAREKRPAIGIHMPRRMNLSDAPEVSQRAQETPSLPFGYVHNREGDEHAKLLVFYFLLHHRRTGVRSGASQFWSNEIRQWWQEHGSQFGTCDLNAVRARSVSSVFHNMAKDKDISEFYGLSSESEGSGRRWIVSVSDLAVNGARRYDVPDGWAEEYREDGTWGFRRTRAGVTLTLDDPSREVPTAFDVIATMADGAGEHRTVQKDDSCTHTFSEWAKAGDELEQRFLDYRVAFDHPFHGQPVFNLSDPPHLWKKIVNALWYSDLPWKSRNLAKVYVDPETGDFELVEFSLKTLERVWFTEERGGGKWSLEEETAQLTRYSNVVPEMFNKNSFNCMSVRLAVKTLSATAVRMCNDANAKLVRHGQKPDPAITCYAEMAREVNDFVDIMNGVYNRNPIDVSKGIDVWKSCITSKDSPLLERLLEILQWFDDWRENLKLFGGADLNIDDFFLPDPTWCDLRLTILGLVAMTRYVFGDEGWVTEGSRGRHIFLRDWNQDICEKRFAHIRTNQGTHKNPRKEGAFMAGHSADIVRQAQESKRRDPDHGRDTFKLDLGCAAAEATMPVNEKQRLDPMRVEGSSGPGAVRQARVLRRQIS